MAPKSSPLFQLSKIWETINNIKLKDKIGHEIPIAIEKKKELADFLDNNESLSYTNLLKILGLKKEDVYGNKQLEKGLQGNTTKAAIIKLLHEQNNGLLTFNLSLKEYSYVDKETGEILFRKAISESAEHEPLYQLWHTIYSIHDLDECRKVLIKKFKVTEEESKRLSSLDFTKQGFGNKSAKAIRKTLPSLMEGYKYSDACKIIGYNHSNSLTKEENEKRELLEKLKPLGKNSLRQPIVEKILNQMINLVNSIIEKHGKPDEIRVELARELKQSREERNETDKAMRRIEKENEDIKKRLQEYGLRTTRNNIIKWRLYHEINNEDKKLNACCIYCGHPISLTAAIRGEEVDIEHIIPQSLLFDDSQGNKTLAHRKCNATKGNMTAYDFMKSKSPAEFDAYIDRVNSLYKNQLIKKGKRDKFLMSGEKIPDNFIDRQLRETQYISKKAKEILTSVCKNVWATSGNITSELRHIWGWDDVLMNLQLPKYRENNEVEWEEYETHGQVHRKERIKGWTKRDDHRHHAIDALTIACTQQGFIQRLNTLNASKTKDEMNNALKEFQTKKTEESEKLYNEKKEAFQSNKLKLHEKYLLSQKPFTTDEVEKAASNVLISFKPGKKVATWGVRKALKGGKKQIVQDKGIIIPRGSLSEESVYGRIKSTEIKPLKYLFENPELIVKPYIKKLVQDKIQEYEKDVKKAMNALKKEPLMIREGVELTFGRCYKEEFVIKYPLASLKAKDVDSIIDKQVKEIVKERLAEFNNNEKEAFKDLEKNPVWFNEDKKIPIKSVRCFTGLSSVEPLRKNESGEPIAFVKPGNNHHIAIYTDKDGKPQEHVCTFWHAVERKKYDIPVIITNPAEVWDKVLNQPTELPESFKEKLPQDQWKFELSMQQNEMFLLGIEKNMVEELIRDKNYAVLSNYLYRAQKISSNDYYFRHHLETNIIDTKEAMNMKRFYRIRSLSALENLKPIKVKVTGIGDISII